MKNFLKLITLGLVVAAAATTNIYSASTGISLTNKVGTVISILDRTNANRTIDLIYVDGNVVVPVEYVGSTTLQTADFGNIPLIEFNVSDGKSYDVKIDKNGRFVIQPNNAQKSADRAAKLAKMRAKFSNANK